MSDKSPCAFRAACRGGSGLTLYKEFDSQPAAQAWARANVQTFDRITVEARERDGWQIRDAFHNRA